MSEKNDVLLETQATAWLEVYDLCVELGMVSQSDGTGKDDVIAFIKSLSTNSELVTKLEGQPIS